MSRQVLLINITRMGDLVQMGALLHRLQEEWPGVGVDLVVDRRFAPVAALLPFLRRVYPYDFHALVDDTRVNARDLVSLYRDTATWALPLAQAGYDRVINLTFNKRSGLLASFIGAPDVRGVASARDGRVMIQNDWMAYLTDMHHYRRFNRFNLVDIYAWGGSGRGSFAPLSLRLPETARDWARSFLRGQGAGSSWVAVQVGASDVMKAWRPEHFGRTLACLGKQADCGFVFIGAPEEREAVQQAKRAYRAAGGSRPVVEAVGRTDLVQLAALLTECKMLLTNDTGPMHLAVAGGTPVVDLSVGHVDFRETGPYGPGHWVVQPDLGCAPCSFEQVCLHHACKDRLVPEQIAALCLHVLNAGPFPPETGGIRIYASAVDEDGLSTYRLCAGREDSVDTWYGAFWRARWFEEFTGSPSACAPPVGAPPDCEEAITSVRMLLPLAARLVSRAHTMLQLAMRHPLPVQDLKRSQLHDEADRAAALDISLRSPATSPVTVALLRQLHSDEGDSLSDLARGRLNCYRRWRTHLVAIETSLSHQARSVERRSITRALPMVGEKQTA